MIGGASQVDQSFEQKKPLVVSKINITIENSKLKNDVPPGNTQRSSIEHRKLVQDIAEVNKTEHGGKKVFGMPQNTISLKDLFPPE